MRAKAKRTRRATAASAPASTPTARKESGAAAKRAGNARAYEQLKQAVLSGRFRPGEVVTLRSVMKLLGAQEMAAREAVKRLISEGGFNALPNRSARAPVLDRKEVKQLCELRIMLESEAAAAAAAYITLHQIEALRVMHQQMAACVVSGDLEQYKCLNMAFHFEIYRIADNPPLANLIESLW